MPWTTGLYFALAAAGMILAAASAGVETGLYRVNRIRLHIQADRGNHRARVLQRLLGDTTGMITVCLIGTNVGYYTITHVTTHLIQDSGWVEGRIQIEITATAILTPTLFVFCEVVPKSVFAYHADRLIFPLARLLRVAYVSLSGILLVPGLKKVSKLMLWLARAGRRNQPVEPFPGRRRLRAFLREGVAEGVITGYQHELLGRVMALRETPLRQVMTPLDRVVSVPATCTREAFIDTLRHRSHNRLPVYVGRPDNVVGIVQGRQMLALADQPFDVRRFMDPRPMNLEVGLSVSQALVRMRKAHQTMALVRGRRGRVVGLVTLKDVAAEIVGEIEEEHGSRGSGSPAKGGG